MGEDRRKGIRGKERGGIEERRDRGEKRGEREEGRGTKQWRKTYV